MEKIEILKISYIKEGRRNELLEKFQISTKYETEPPRGDAIYSIKFKNKPLPFWIYGRNIIFIADRYVMLESVKYNTWDPICTIIVDLKNGLYTNLKQWYTDISFLNNKVELSNRIVKIKKLILKDLNDLNWMDL